MNLLKIEKATDDQRMVVEEVNDEVMDHVAAGIEVISGKRGRSYIGVRPFWNFKIYYF